MKGEERDCKRNLGIRESTVVLISSLFTPVTTVVIISLQLRDCSPGSQLSDSFRVKFETTKKCVMQFEFEQNNFEFVFAVNLTFPFPKLKLSHKNRTHLAALTDYFDRNT